MSVQTPPDDPGNEAVDRILKRSAFCWLTTGCGLEHELRSPRRRVLEHPHLTIDTADHDAAPSDVSSRLYSLPDRNVSVELNLPPRFDQVGLGAMVWSSAVGLSIWLSRAARTGELSLAGVRLLELGAGVGLPGLLCAQLGADAPLQITLTDLSGQLVDCMRANARCNAKDGAPLPNADILNWDDRTAYSDCDEYDIVIGADLVYSPAHVTQLVQTVLPRLATGLSTLVLVQPGKYTETGFDTRNGWADLKAALNAVGTLELHRMQLALSEQVAMANTMQTDSVATVNAAGNADERPHDVDEMDKGACASSSEALVCTDLELLVFHKEVLCLMPPSTPLDR